MTTTKLAAGQPFPELNVTKLGGGHLTLGKVQLVDISNAPFVRPDLQSLVKGLAFIRNPENNYPVRGTYGGS
ncbi:hypothetical protein [Pseudomaricurvus alkylphenolicus]|uniref:hypothetical protein n=1 Tax=Pseudomaricurvus alkylphenolicus TaxID=1306991 RepID=UPI00197F07FA|nr:hypothetical protein [Pseudomaricurvus alkylphenolicus]